ncbi:MAG: family 10 glycosylhydrolase [Chthoniobacter sp.]|nr:family 10 glycosylhydrolase [Chthoniobacter sp.]
MKIPLLCLLFLSLLGAPLRAQPEFRGAWVATVFNLDWPSKPGLSATEQKAQFRDILDRAQQLKLNAILLQVRSVSDAFYTSKREPWSAFLSGKQGVDPGYDPLAFAIAEAHARGIELHAWFNPFRAGTSAKGTYAANHVTHTHPDWVRTYGGQLWLDPGEPEARRYILDVILDVVKRYDIDGVHIDDYFYPYPVKGAEFPDDVTWQHYGQASGMARADWRRDNINRFVEAMYRGVKAAKPSVRVGISPFGIWRPKVPATIEAQLDSYAQLYADARHWLSQGWCDYLAPQLYWGIQPDKQSFPVLLKWWRDQSQAGRPIWPGIATERIGKQFEVHEIARQIALTRQGLPANGEPGNIQWSMKALMKDQGGVDALLQSNVYGERAELPRR